MRGCGRAWVIVVLLATVATASALPGPAVADPETDRVAIAPVVVDGATLFSIRGVTAFPAAQRAAIIADRIRAVADDPAIASDTVHIAETDLHSDILAGEQVVMSVFDADADVEGVHRETLALALRERIRTAIDAYRRERTSAFLGRAAWVAAGTLAGLLVAVLLILHLSRGLDVLLERRYRRRIQAIGIQSFQIVEAERVWTLLRGTIRGSRNLLMFGLVWVGIAFVLGLFPWTRGFANDLLELVVAPLRTMALGIVGYLPNLGFLAVLAVVTRWALRLLYLFFEALDRGTLRFAGFEAEWAWPTYRIVRILALAFAAIVAFPYIPGSESAAFRGVSIFLGVVFSLGSSSVIANMMAGYSLIYRRTFKVGDRVKIEDVIGDVVEMRLQETHLRSLTNEEVIFPNSHILSNPVINYSAYARQHGLILHTDVGIGYEVPWRQVESMLLLAAERTPGLRTDPPPFVLQKQLGDFAVTYALHAHYDDPQQMMPLHSALHRNVLDVFNEYGVQIMTPAYERDPETPKVVPKGEWHAPPARAE